MKFSLRRQQKLSINPIQTEIQRVLPNRQKQSGELPMVLKEPIEKHRRLAR